MVTPINYSTVSYKITWIKTHCQQQKYRPANTHNIYYQNQFSNSYKTDERIIKQIVKDNTKCVNESDLLKITIYCKTHTINNLISKNNLSHKSNRLKTNIVYKYTCNVGDCELQNSTYIGMTTTALSRRLTMHLASGGPKINMQNNHNSTISRENLVQNTNILYYEPDFNRLQIVEAILIQELTLTSLV